MPNFVKRFTSDENIIANHTLFIEYETLFKKMVLSDAKKCYAGIVKRWKGLIVQKDELYYKGIALTRKDTPVGIKNMLSKIVEDIFYASNYDGIKKDINECKTILKKIDIKDLIIYKNLTHEINEYKVLPQHARAAKYSNTYLGTNFSKENYRGGMVYIKKVRHGLPETDVIFLDVNMHLPDGFLIDYEKYFDMYVKRKLRLIFSEKFYNKNLETNNLLQWVKN